MTNPSLRDLYEQKDSDYFESARPEMLEFVPTGAKRILDIGCGAALFSGVLKQRLDAEVWGVELNVDASRKAAARIDHVLNAQFAADLNLPRVYFDAICFLDVLEHMPDPAIALRHAASLLAPGGRVVASIPNFRYFDNIWELVVRKSARYEVHGIMDRTHLRIFTKSSIALLFEEAAMTIERIEGINPKVGSDKFAIANALTFGWLSDTRFQQFAVVARLGSATP